MEKVHRNVEEAPASHMEHRGCGVKIERPWFCPECQNQVSYGDLVRVFENGEEGKANGEGDLVLSQEEFKGARLDEKKLVIEQFVRSDELDPIYLSDQAYWMHLDAPKKSARNGLFAWSALVQKMIEMDVVALASWVSRGKDYILVLRPYSGEKGRTLVAQVMEYGEIIETECIDLQDVADTDEVTLLAMLIEQYRHEFDASRYESEYAKSLRSVLAQKSGGEEPKLEAEDQETADLIERLKASLASA